MKSLILLAAMVGSLNAWAARTAVEGTCTVTESSGKDHTKNFNSTDEKSRFPLFELDNGGKIRASLFILSNETDPELIDFTIVVDGAALGRKQVNLQTVTVRGISSDKYKDNVIGFDLQTPKSLSQKPLYFRCNL